MFCQPVPEHMTAMPSDPVCDLPPGATNADAHECIVRAERDRRLARSKLRQIDIHQEPCR